MQEDKAKKYHRIKNWLFLFNLALSLLVLILLLHMGLSTLFKYFAYTIINNYYLVVLVYFLLLSLTFFVVSLPMDFYEGFILEHKFELAQDTFFAWVKRYMKKAVISLVVGIIMIEVLYFFLHNFARVWWVLAGLAWLAFSVILARIVPVLIVPLFYKYKKIEDVNLKERIIALANKCQVKVIDVFGIDFSKETKKANAAVIGLGKTRRVVLTDTLMANYTLDEIESVLAHEFAHHVFKHMHKLIIFAGLTTFLSLFILNIILSRALMLFSLREVYNISAFPVVAIILSLFSLVMMPLQNGFSRKLEKEADLYALNTTKNKSSFVSLMEKLAAQNLSEKSPSKFIEFMLYDHPPIGKRIKSAGEFKNE